ncbi:MAG: hypothetical protein JO097_08190 [Acidobacteriaceae bacterium]|nr:hypothetical protein [Acidobacteriaceae bacterium]MBV9765445.1 hypothetical protein [Acidobacteriaceae bacterium]
MSAYQPDSAAATELVEQLIREKWYLQRNLRRYEELERELSPFPFPSWTAEQHKQFQLALRYKTAAERAVSRAMHDLQAWIKSRQQQENQMHKAEKELFGSWFKVSGVQWKNEITMTKLIGKAQAQNVDISEPVAAMANSQKQLRATIDRIGKKIEESSAPASRAKTLFQGQYHPKKLRKIPILDQWIEITVENGHTVTKLFPANDRLIQEGQAMDPPPEMVYRRLNFVNGVPPEYHWATKDEGRRQRGGMGVQRMSIDTWLDVIDREQADPSGHIGPCGGNLPRPKERGNCDCEVCTYNRDLLEQRI